MNKPKHVSEEVWQQHVRWMKVMSEGQLTLDPYQRYSNGRSNKLVGIDKAGNKAD